MQELDDATQLLYNPGVDLSIQWANKEVSRDGCAVRQSRTLPRGTAPVACMFAHWTDIPEEPNVLIVGFSTTWSGPFFRVANAFVSREVRPLQADGSKGSTEGFPSFGSFEVPSKFLRFDGAEI